MRRHPIEYVERNYMHFRYKAQPEIKARWVFIGFTAFLIGMALIAQLYQLRG